MVNARGFVPIHRRAGGRLNTSGRGWDKRGGWWRWGGDRNIRVDNNPSLSPGLVSGYEWIGHAHPLGNAAIALNLPSRGRVMVCPGHQDPLVLGGQPQTISISHIKMNPGDQSASLGTRIHDALLEVHGGLALPIYPRVTAGKNKQGVVGAISIDLTHGGVKVVHIRLHCGEQWVGLLAV